MTGDNLRADWHFAVIPEWVLYAQITAQAVRLYGVLRRHADKSNEAWPGRRRLADAMCVSPKTVDRALEELVEIGAVEIVQRFIPGGQQTSNLYRLFSLPPGARVSRGVDTGVHPPLDTGDEGGWTRVSPLPWTPVSTKGEPLEREPVERETPLTPASAGGAGCAAHPDGPAPSCRECGTNPRSVRSKAKASRIGAACGQCGPNRMIDLEDGTAMHCPRCHPRARSAS